MFFRFKKSGQIISCNKDRKAIANAEQLGFATSQGLELVVEACYLIRMCPQRMPMNQVSVTNFRNSHQSSIESSQK